MSTGIGFSKALKKGVVSIPKIMKFDNFCDLPQ